MDTTRPGTTSHAWVKQAGDHGRERLRDWRMAKASRRYNEATALEAAYVDRGRHGNMSIRGKAAVVGIHEYGSRFDPQASELSIQAESAREALEDAGLTIDDVDALYCHSARAMTAYMNLNPDVLDTTHMGGGSYEFFAAHAAAAIAAGQCEVALVTYGSTARSARRGRGGRQAGGDEGGTAFWPQAFEAPYGTTTPGIYGLVARRHMHEYGTTSEQLAEIAVATRQHASTNPFAVMRDPITVSDVVNSRMVSDPLHLLDCCLVTDGGGAFIVTSAERAKDLKKKPAYILGGGQAVAHPGIGNRDLTTIAAAQSSKKAYAEAGVTPNDIDLLMAYDSFTITVMCTIEDLGFAPKGEGGRFVEGGTLTLNGKLPMNTDGGGLSSNHPGQRGIFLIFEAVRQLRGEREGNQVENCEVALAHGTGGALSLWHSGGTVVLANSV